MLPVNPNEGANPKHVESETSLNIPGLIHHIYLLQLTLGLYKNSEVLRFQKLFLQYPCIISSCPDFEPMPSIHTPFKLLFWLVKNCDSIQFGCKVPLHKINIHKVI